MKKKDYDRIFRVDLIDYSVGKVAGKKSLLKPFTSFKVPGAVFSKQYKKKRWDGTVSIIKWNKLPLGLIPYMVVECAKRGLEINFYLNGTKLTPVELEKGLFEGPKWKVDTFIEMLNLLPDNIVSRYYQIDSLEIILKSARGLLILPTGSGKSLSIYMLAYALRSTLKTGLIVVPRADLVDQIALSFQHFSNGTVEVLTSTQYGRQLLDMLDNDRNVIISTWQSWSSWLKDGIAVDPDYVIVDEAHTLAKNRLPWDYMKAFANTKYRYGLTATENELIQDRLVLEGLLGPVLYKEMPEKLIEKGYLAKPMIRRLFLKHNLGIEPGNKVKVSTRDLVRRPERMHRIAHFIDKHIPADDSLLILTEAVEEEIMPLTDILVEELRDTDIFQLTRIARRKEREAVIGIVNEPQRRTVLVVTFGLFQMGIDIPSLKHIMLFSPSKSHIRVLQSIGRGLRPKEFCYVYDIIDYCEEKADTMASKRLSIYKGAYGDQLEIIDDYWEI